MTPTSRFFGPVSPRATYRVVESASIPSALSGVDDIRLVLADPLHARQSHLDQADAALDFFEQFDARARDAVARAASDDLSVPGRIFADASVLTAGRRITPQEFANGLRVTSVVVSPDGGDGSPDRLAVTYATSRGSVQRVFRAIVRVGSGLVFAETEEERASAGNISYR
ncbi:hypothetical protein [Leucobacter triazinivorans]|uniref:Uncharacterized protein n=1 Tax=Leucobacter triazinivorans TaxID=1784719 RepID=A0A4P6KFX2_9MICO|nr:hypothetical protein [Leucobacter triazinivorans]QBE49385.1 hypothetical protein EVS81_11505 [Leucobacter triazinivorans]